MKKSHERRSSPKAAYARGESTSPESGHGHRFARGGQLLSEFVYARGGSMSPDFGYTAQEQHTAPGSENIPHRASLGLNFLLACSQMYSLGRIIIPP
jgi:hypothetical protein